MNQEDDEAETAFLSKIMCTGELTTYFLLKNAAEADSSPLKQREMPIEERLSSGLPTTGPSWPPLQIRGRICSFEDTLLSDKGLVSQSLSMLVWLFPAK